MFPQLYSHQRNILYLLIMFEDIYFIYVYAFAFILASASILYLSSSLSSSLSYLLILILTLNLNSCSYFFPINIIQLINLIKSFILFTL